MKPIKIVLADDHQVMRSGLRTLLENEDDFEVVAEAGNGRLAIKLIQEYQPQIVVMDVTMPDMSGINATHHITSRFPDILVLGLSMHLSEAIVVEMFKAGAVGYLTKNCAAKELVAAIRHIQKGKLYFSSEIPSRVADKLLHPKNKTSPSTHPKSLLSHREREVLQLVAEGKPSKAIADELFISEKTVGAHRQNIMNKLDLRSVAELTKFAIREGLTPLD